MKRAVIYARYSAGPHQTDVSIEGQEKVCQDYIARKEYGFVRMYADRHISGRTDKRPAFQRMIDDARSGSFDVVVVYSLDRFSRDKYDSAIYKKMLRDCGVVVESASENIPDGPEGIMFEGILESLAVYYSAELSKKIRRGMDVKARKCLSTGGPTPFGYVLQDGSYHPDPNAAPHVAEVFRMYLSGSSFADCARYLNGLGFTTSKGKPFSSGTVRKILTNKKYCGYYVYNGMEVEGGMPQLIDENTFFKVHKMIAKNKPHRPRGDFALTGKLICGICGEHMTGTSGTSKTGAVHYYYKCPSKDRKNIPRDLIEHTVAQYVRDALSDPERIDAIVDRLFALHLEEDRTQAKSSALADNLKRIEKKIDGIVDHIMENGSSPALADKLSALEEDRAILRSDLDQLQSEPVLTRDMIRAGLQLALLGDQTTDADVIRIFVHQVLLHEDHLIIEFNIKGHEGLQKTDLLEFDLCPDWWTIGALSRTLTVYRGSILLIGSINL